MKVIARPNNTGKTKELLLYSFEHNIPIFAFSKSKASSLNAKSYSYFQRPANVVDIFDLLSGNYVGDILVDDLADTLTEVVKSMYNSIDVSIVGCTLTVDEDVRETFEEKVENDS